MSKIFYRVGDYPITGVILNSNTYNYGKSFGKEYDYLLDSYFNVANKIDLPIDFLIYINNGFANEGNYFLKRIKTAILNEIFVDIFKVTGNIKHTGIIIPINLLNEFIQSFDEKNTFKIFLEGNYLWERYFEMVREKVFKELPSRKESIFLFDNVDDCQFYIKNHKKGFGKIYEVEIIEEEALFRADMNIYEEIDLSITYNNLLKEFFKYWDKQSSQTPRYEYLFQGQCRIKNVL